MKSVSQSVRSGLRRTCYASASSSRLRSRLAMSVWVNKLTNS
jgi:hypothetical protein